MIRERRRRGRARAGHVPASRSPCSIGRCAAATLSPPGSRSLPRWRSSATTWCPSRIHGRGTPASRGGGLDRGRRAAPSARCGDGRPRHRGRPRRGHRPAGGYALLETAGLRAARGRCAALILAALLLLAAVPPASARSCLQAGPARGILEPV